MLSKKQIERRVDVAMNAASRGLQIPLSRLGGMGKLATQAVEADNSLEGGALVEKCRAIMIQQGATEAE